MQIDCCYIFLIVDRYTIYTIYRILVINIWVTYIYGIGVVEMERVQSYNLSSRVATLSSGCFATDKSINIVARIV
jgi:hypothetical protein